MAVSGINVALLVPPDGELSAKGTFSFSLEWVPVTFQVLAPQWPRLFSFCSSQGWELWEEMLVLF